MMNKELVALERLQRIDIQVDEETRKLREIPARVEEMRHDVEHVGNMLKREKDRVEEMEKWRVDHEKEVALQNELLTKAKNKLQQSRNEREHKAAQREIETIRKAMQDREGEILDLMEAIEQFKKSAEEHGSEFEELKTHLEKEETEAETSMAEMEKIIEAKRSGREDVIKDVPKKILCMYERIQNRMGTALVEAKDGSCSGCNMAVEPQRLIELQKGQKLIQCAICNRILYIKEVTEIETENS